MRNKTTRRGFLAASAVGIAAMIAPKNALANDNDNKNYSTLSSADTREIKEVISAFLESYFCALSANGSCTAVYNGLYDNDDMHMVKAMNEWHKQCMVSMGYSYEDICTTVSFDEIIATNNNRVLVLVDFLLEFRYSDIDPGGRTSRLRLDYQFILLRTETAEWQISSIKTDYDMFKRFENKVEYIKSLERKSDETRRIADIAKEILLLEDEEWFLSLASRLPLSNELAAKAREDSQVSRGWQCIIWSMPFFTLLGLLQHRLRTEFSIPQLWIVQISFPNAFGLD